MVSSEVKVEEKEKIIIAGANGFIGQELTLKLSQRFDVVTLTRKTVRIQGASKNVLWDGRNVGDWAIELESATAIINLSGKSVNCRFNESNMKAILDSRVESTLTIGKAIEQCKLPPKVWINASGISIYKESFHEPMTESTKDFDTDFLAQVTRKWEDACLSCAKDVRKVLLRTPVVLGGSGGTYPIFRRLTNFFLGGKQGRGDQMFSWIHIDDYCRIVEQVLIPDETISGPINMVAPEVVTNQLLMKSFRKHQNIPFGIPSPEWVLKIGGFIIGTEPSLTLKSSCVKSEVLKAKRFEFQHSKIDETIGALTVSKKNEKS